MHARAYKIINENYTYRWHMVKKTLITYFIMTILSFLYLTLLTSFVGLSILTIIKLGISMFIAVILTIIFLNTAFKIQ